jgi:acyl-coenzyme A synthetase/AMP-(fatty) acid ligase
MAVWSGDTVRRDEEGFLYFVGRSDDMIKVSGYRISPTEVEEMAYATGLVEEAVAFGVPHPELGQAVVLLAVTGATTGASTGATTADAAAALLKECQRRMPAYMVPAHVALRHEAFPRNPNGKIDRKELRAVFLDLFDNPPSA